MCSTVIMAWWRNGGLSTRPGPCAEQTRSCRCNRSWCTASVCNTSTISGINTSTIQAPYANLLMTTTHRTIVVTAAPSPFTTIRQCQPTPRCFHQWRAMPTCDSVKVANAPTVNSGTSAVTLPRNNTISTPETVATSTMPLVNAKRDPRTVNACGTMPSRASSDNSRGKSANPVSAASTRSNNADASSTRYAGPPPINVRVSWLCTVSVSVGSGTTPSAPERNPIPNISSPKMTASRNKVRCAFLVSGGLKYGTPL